MVLRPPPATVGHPEQTRQTPALLGESAGAAVHYPLSVAIRRAVSWKGSGARLLLRKTTGRPEELTLAFHRVIRELYSRWMGIPCRGWGKQPLPPFRRVSQERRHNRSFWQQPARRICAHRLATTQSFLLRVGRASSHLGIMISPRRHRCSRN